MAYESPFWSIACSFVVMILGRANTNVACFVRMRDDAFLLHDWVGERAGEFWNFFPKKVLAPAPLRFNKKNS